MTQTPTLFVGNLDRVTTESTLRGIFERDGRRVTAVKLVISQKNGRPRGFAFVELASADQAVSAQQALDGSELDGRAIRVREAKERRAGDGGFMSTYGKGRRRDDDDWESGGFGGGGRGGGRGRY